MNNETPPSAGTGAELALNSPLDLSALDRLLTRAVGHEPKRIVDHGCGWGEVLLRAVSAVPGATGLGIDVHRPDLDRGEAAAEQMSLTDRVKFVEGSCVDHREPADLLINLGAYQAFGSPANALRCLREDAAQGGRVLFGLEYWTQVPTASQLSMMWPEASVDDCMQLPQVLRTVLHAGWRILDLHDSTRAEFDSFEVGHLRPREQWAAAHRDHHDYTEVAAELDNAWLSWVSGHRVPMGFVTLVLA